MSGEAPGRSYDRSGYAVSYPSGNWHLLCAEFKRATVMLCLAAWHCSAHMHVILEAFASSASIV